MTTDSTEDARLVQSTLQGDRRSFEQIVLRYQNLIASIAYSGTGDRTLSEELAQETFLAAWRNLAQLREPASLRSWLAGIVRTLAANARRSLARKPTCVALPPDLEELAGCNPAEQVVGQDERALMWETLLQLPESYREPLILFYREERSVRRVAEDLGLTEEAVRQRLSRGRQLLTARVLALVETTLEKTKPDRTFVAGVMAALPAFAPQALSAAMLAAGGKGSLAAKAALVGGMAAAVFGPILGFVGGVFAILVGVRSAKSAPERRLMIRVGLLVIGTIALLNLFLAIAYALASAAPPAVACAVLVALSGLYVAGLIWLALWAVRRQHQIRVETGTETTPQQELATLTAGRLAALLAGSTAGSIAWILFMALVCADGFALLAIAAVAIGAFGVSFWLAASRPSRYYRVAIALTATLAALNLAVINLRWPLWVSQVLPEDASRESLAFPLWALNLLLIGIFTLVLTSLVYRVHRLQS